MNRIKRLVALITLGATLAFPVGVAAESDPAETTESLTVANTVSMTAQASTTYVLGDYDGTDGPDFAARAVLTVLSSNNPSGVNVTAQVDDYETAGSILVPTAKRQTLLDNIDCRTGDGAAAPHDDSDPPGTGGVNSGGYICPSAPAPVTRSGAALVKSFTFNASAFASEASVVTVANASGPLANADLGSTFIVDADEFPVGGLYTSAIHWVTSTNP